MLLGSYLVFVFRYHEDQNSPSSYQMLLYRVSDSEGRHVYLFGTMHIGNRSIFPLRDEIEAAFDRSDFLVVEIDFSLEHPTGRRFDNPMRNLDLNQGEIEQIEMMWNRIHHGSYKFEDFQDLTPLELLTAVDLRQGLIIGLSPGGGLDLYWMNRALHSETPILEIESMDSQMDAIDYLDRYWSAEILREFLETDPDQVRDLLEKQWEFILSGNAAGLAETLSNYTEFRYAFNQVLLVERDLAMFNVIETYFMDDYVYFIAVGAFHLVHEQGLLELLREAGYTIEQL